MKHHLIIEPFLFGGVRPKQSNKGKFEKKKEQQKKKTQSNSMVEVTDEQTSNAPTLEMVNGILEI